MPLGLCVLLVLVLVLVVVVVLRCVGVFCAVGPSALTAVSVGGFGEAPSSKHWPLFLLLVLVDRVV